MTLRELEVVALVHPVPQAGLAAGERGTVVTVLGDGEACIVEFVNAEGRTTAIETIEASGLRPVLAEELARGKAP